MNGFDSSLDARPRPSITPQPLHVGAGMPPPPPPSQVPATQVESAEETAETEAQGGPSFERMRGIAITTSVTHVLATAPISTLYQRASIARNPSLPLIQPSSALAALRHHAGEFKQFHRRESFPFVLGSGLLDLCDGALSGAALGIFVELSKFGWFLLSLNDDLVLDPLVPHHEKDVAPEPTLAQRVRDALYFGVSNAASFAAVAALCLPLHIANFQVRHHLWRGWRPGVFPLRANGYWKALPTLSVEYQFMQILNRQLRRKVYDFLGRPFSQSLHTLRRIEREEKAARRRVKGKEKLDDSDDEGDDEERDEDADGVTKTQSSDDVGAKGKETAQQRRRGKGKREGGGGKDVSKKEEDEDLELGDLGRELLRQASFHLLTRGIAIGVTLLTSVVHMPLCAITNSILASPSAYTGPIDCAQKILAAEGWQGFYKGLFWHVVHSSDVLFLHDVWTGAELSLAD